MCLCCNDSALLMKQLSGHQSQDVSVTGLAVWNGRVLSEHFINGLATIAAVNAQLLQSNLVIMRHNFLPPRRRRSRNSITPAVLDITCFIPYSVPYPEQYKYNIRVNGLHIYKHVKVGTLIASSPLPMPTNVTGSPGTGHRLSVPVSTRINEQEVEQAACCLKVTPGL